MVEGSGGALATLREQAGAPLRLAVTGRPGAGRRTVAAAIRAAGHEVDRSGDSSELTVHVLAEVLTDEDRDALGGAVRSGRPVVAVLNKADLSGFRGPDPMTVAAARCREVARETAVPTVPLAALVALAAYPGLDDVLQAGLRALIVDPRGVDAGLRGLLLDHLGYYGLAHGVTAVRAGAGEAGVTAALRRVSGMPGLLAAVRRAGAPVRYRRVRSAWRVLNTRAALEGTLASLLAGDAALEVRAEAAADVLRSAGLRIDAADCLREAVAWRRYAHGPAGRLHRDCALDVSRALLRRWAAR